MLTAVIVIEPVGIFGHFLHDHIGHTRAADGGLRAGGDDAPGGDDHHWHHLMLPADVSDNPGLRTPRPPVATVTGRDVGSAVASPFLLFSPPRH